jgi:hypothetical protein
LLIITYDDMRAIDSGLICLMIEHEVHRLQQL